jgi:ABC-type amino acid transport substrate-binding protein
VLKTRNLTLVIVALLLLSVAAAACSGEGGATATSPAAKALLDVATNKTATAKAAAEAGGTVMETSLTVGSKKLTITEIQALTAATAETEFGSVTGTSLKAVLEAGGITGGTISLASSDGKSVDVAVAEIDDTAIVQVDNGKFGAIIPTVAAASRIDGLVSITAK